MSETIYLTTLFAILGTVLGVFAVRALAAVREARARAAADGAYELLAARSATALGEAATRLAAMQEAIGTLGGRLAAIETMLREVG